MNKFQKNITNMSSVRFPRLIELCSFFLSLLPPPPPSATAYIKNYLPNLLSCRNYLGNGTKIPGVLVLEDLTHEDRQTEEAGRLKVGGKNSQLIWGINRKGVLQRRTFSPVLRQRMGPGDIYGELPSHVSFAFSGLALKHKAKHP